MSLRLLEEFDYIFLDIIVGMMIKLLFFFFLRLGIYKVFWYEVKVLCIEISKIACIIVL